MERAYGKWDAVALQDLCLQTAKKIQAKLLKPRYQELSEEIRRFQSVPHYREQVELSAGSTVLLFKPDDIGDAVYALPAIQKLKQKYPGIRLHLICQKKTECLYARTGLFDSVSAVNPTVRFLRFPSFDLDAALDVFSGEKFDVAVFLRTYPAYFRLFKKIPALFHVHPKDPRLKSDSAFQAYVSLYGDKRAHQAVQMLEIISRLTNERYSEKDLVFPKFHWKEEDSKGIEKVFGTKTPEPYLVVHPFVKFETRRYPYSYWKEILSALQKTSPMKIVIIGGKEDPQLDLPSTLQAQGKLSLAETGYLISKAEGFLGVESGPAHWAGALGKKVAMIFGGHSHLSEWGPLGNSLVLKHSVPCENCYLRACPKYKVRCLTELKPTTVLEKLIPFLRGN